MEEVTRNFLLAKAQTLRNLTQADVAFLETMVTKTSEDILELRGMLAPLASRRDVATMEDFNPIENVSRIADTMLHIQVTISMLQQRKDMLNCCLKGMRASVAELLYVSGALNDIPVVGVADASSEA